LIYWIVSSGLAMHGAKSAKSGTKTYVDVVLSLRRMGNEGLDQERPQNADRVLDLLRLAGALSNPRPRLGPRLVEGQQTALAAALDELIGLRDEPGTGLEQPGICLLGLVEDGVDVGALRKAQRRKFRRRVVLGRRRQRTRLDHWSPGEVIVEDGLAVGLVDALRRHGKWSFS